MATPNRAITGKYPVKKPAVRAFDGLAGSALTVVKKIPPQIAPKDSPLEVVLVHFCFDQERAGTKPDRCSCNLRVTKDRSYDIVDAKQADFLLVKNPKTDKLTKFHKAIVVRRAIVAGETLFALSPPVKLSPRDAKHQAIKAAITRRARGILQKLLAAGVISHHEANISDSDLEAGLRDPDSFLEHISARKRMQGDWREVAFQWWGNILGYHRLDKNAGQYLTDADRGKGLVVTGTNDRSSLTARLETISGLGDTDTGKVVGGSGKASYWSGGWDYKTGTDPVAFWGGEIDE